MQLKMESAIKSSQQTFDEMIEIEKEEKTNYDAIKSEIERLTEEMIRAIKLVRQKK